MGKRFKKRFSSLCCCRVRVSDASDLEVKDVKGKTSNQRTFKPAVSTADVNPRFLTQTERRLVKENMFIKKLDNFHEFLNQSVDDLGCKFKGIVRMDKTILKKYIEVIGDFGITQESVYIPNKVEDDVKKKEIVNEIQLKDFNNVLSEDIRRETKALLFDIQKRNKDHEKRFVDGLQGHNLSTNASVPFVDAEMDTVEAFSRHTINDSPLKYRELTPWIDAVNHFTQTSPLVRDYKKTGSCNLSIYNADDVFRHTEYTPTKPNMDTVVTLPVKYGTQQTLECVRYIPEAQQILECVRYMPEAQQTLECVRNMQEAQPLECVRYMPEVQQTLECVRYMPEAQQTLECVRYMPEAQQTLECARYMPKRGIGFYNLLSSQENTVAWKASITFHSTFDGILGTVLTLPVKYAAQQTLEYAGYMPQAQQAFECAGYMPQAQQTLEYAGYMSQAQQAFECARYMPQAQQTLEYAGYMPQAQQAFECAGYMPQAQQTLEYAGYMPQAHQAFECAGYMPQAQQTLEYPRYMPQAHQAFECAGYMPQRGIELYNPSSSQANKSAWVQTILDRIVNNYTVTVVRTENEGLHLPVSTPGQQSFIQGPVWVFSFTPKARILQSDQHQELMPTMDNKKHVITVCVSQNWARLLDKCGLIKGETRAILNQDVSFRIENPSMSTLPFASASVGQKLTEFIIRRPAIMQVEISQDRQHKHVFQTEKLTDRAFSLATVKVATVFTYDEPMIPIVVPMRIHKILSQTQASRLINGPSLNVLKVISNKDSNDAVTHLVATLRHSTNNTKNKRKKLKALVTISNVRSLKELCQMVRDKVTTPEPSQSENMVRQCLTYPGHTDQEASEDLAASVAGSDNKVDEHCGDGDQQGSGGSPRLINENASKCVPIKTGASPKSDGRYKPKEYPGLSKSFEKPRLKAPSRINECPVVAGFPHAERRPKADKYPGTYRQSDKSPRSETAPDGLVPSRSDSKGQALANVKDESMQDIDKHISLKTKLPEVKEDLSKVYRFVHNKRPMLSLKYLMGKGFHFEEIHAKFLSINLLHILRFLLDRRIIHADICPEKIVFNNKGYPCLTGYEKSEIIGGCRRDSKFEIPKIEFCSPEQFCKKDKITEATDVFSTGVLVYRMLYDRSPHKDVNYQKTKANLLRDSFIPRFKPDGILSWTGKLFIAHCIRHDPNNRFSIKRCQSSLVDSVKWFKGLNEPSLINQTDPSPFSEFLHGNQNIASSGATTTSGTTSTSGLASTSGITTTSGAIHTSGTIGSSGTESSTPGSRLHAMENSPPIKPSSKLPTRIRSQEMVNRLSSQLPIRRTPQHTAA